MGRLARQKGKEFERQIARDMRAIYDPPELVAAIEAADNSERKRLIAQSWVRRAEQGRDTHEPDVVAPCEWWMELQDGTSKTPEIKLAQAKRDLAVYRGRNADGPWRRPVAIYHEKGARSIIVCLELRDLIEGAGGGWPLGANAVAELEVRIDYGEFLKILRSRR